MLPRSDLYLPLVNICLHETLNRVNSMMVPQDVGKRIVNFLLHLVYIGLTVKPAGTPKQQQQHHQGAGVKTPSSSSAGTSSAATGLYPRMPGGGETVASFMPPPSSSPMHRNSSVPSPPGIDLDTVAAVMQSRGAFL